MTRRVALRRRMTTAAAWLRARSIDELAPFAALFLAAAGLFVFGQLADEMLEGETRAFDEAILLALRNPADPADPIGPAWLEGMFIDITALGGTSVLTLITLGVAGYLLMDGKRANAVFVLAAVAGGALLSTAANVMFARPRPELVAHLVDVSTYSFPSGHATAAAVTFLTLGALVARVQSRKRMKAYVIGAAFVLTLLVGASRIYLGEHWPSDVLAGWSLGAAWAMLCWLAARWLQRRGQIERAPGAAPAAKAR